MVQWGLRQKPDYSGPGRPRLRNLDLFYVQWEAIEDFKHLSDGTQFTFRKMSFATGWRLGWRKAKVEAERPVKRLLLCLGEK